MSTCSGMLHVVCATYSLPLAVFFDRDGTLIVDVPGIQLPDDVRAMPGARAAIERLRDARIAVGVVTNQPRIGRGTLSQRELAELHERVEHLLGPFNVWNVCPHAENVGCMCRKPRPGLIRAGARRLGIPVPACVVVGDIGSDVDAAHAAGARAVLVPTPLTLDDEIRSAPVRAISLGAAVDLILQGRV